MNSREPTLQEYELGRIFKRSTITPRDSPDLTHTNEIQSSELNIVNQKHTSPTVEPICKKRQHQEDKEMHQDSLKRKRGTHSPQVNSSMDADTMKTIIAQTIAQTISDNNREIKDQLQKINDKVDQIADTIPKVTLLETKCHVLEEKVYQLENENENLQKLIRRNNLLVSGIQEEPTENADKLKEKVNGMLKLYRIIRNDVTIHTAFRIGKIGPKPRTVKIRLLFQSDADHILFKSKERDSETRKAGIFINEDVSITEGKNRFLIRKKAQKKQKLPGSPVHTQQPNPTINREEEEVILPICQSVEGIRYDKKKQTLVQIKKIRNPKLLN
ncbi:unnamed protein product [Allacma fusca]|uniref:Uncharacterized protein n=1 Tax=Allacma fusca TaxID=39272 RepID=A0A8J2J1I6_9HEXA|nr:unnamed protein product [Allacma fusca]